MYNISHRTTQRNKEVYNPATRIETLDLSVRTHNRLRKARITSLEQLAQARPRDLLRIEGFGKKCLGEIAYTLESLFASMPRAELTPFTLAIARWRPYFAHPELVPVVLEMPLDQNSYLQTPHEE